jgi:hypothetical protein
MMRSGRSRRCLRVSWISGIGFGGVTTTMILNSGSLTDESQSQIHFAYIIL